MTKRAPPYIVAWSANELAAIKAAYLPGYVNAVCNFEHARGAPASLCDELRPSLTAALGAWFDQQFIADDPAADRGAP